MRKFQRNLQRKFWIYFGDFGPLCVHTSAQTTERCPERTKLYCLARLGRERPLFSIDAQYVYFIFYIKIFVIFLFTNDLFVETTIYFHQKSHFNNFDWYSMFSFPSQIYLVIFFFWNFYFFWFILYILFFIWTLIIIYCSNCYLIVWVKKLWTLYW